MARGDYNGFTEADQNRGGQIQTSAYANGMLVRVWNCEGCEIRGHKPGDIIPHLEDYTEPIKGAIWLCYRCHTMLHLRFEYPEAWERYRNEVRNGKTYRATRSYRGVIEDHCKHPEASPRLECTHKPRKITILDQIELGLLLPKGTPAEIRERMDLLHEKGIKALQEIPQPQLF